MEAKHAIGLVITIVLAAIFMPTFISAWRGGGRTRQFMEHGRRLGYSRRELMAILRGASGAVLLFAFLLPAGYLKSTARAMNGGNHPVISRLLSVVADVFFVATVGVVITYTLATLFGRPKWVLPKALREDPGYFERGHDSDR